MGWIQGVDDAIGGRMIFRMMVVCGLLWSGNGLAQGVDCATLPAWGEAVDGYQVNQHHVFCGEPGKRGRAKGFHAMPGGKPPSGYLGAVKADPANGAGIYTLKQIRLSIEGREYVKAFSSLFPSHCSLAQVNQSIVYSLKNKSGACANPGWASCGPNAPKGGGQAYCTGRDGSIFTIATAVLPSDKRKINTGFPIYTP